MRPGIRRFGFVALAAASVLSGASAPAARRKAAPVVQPRRFPLRVVSFGNAPSTRGTLLARLVDAGNGTRTDFDRLGAKARGAIALVRTKPMMSYDDLFAEYLAGPEMLKAAEAGGVAAVLFTSTRPRDLLYRHTITL